jgi:hypothetical protein
MLREISFMNRVIGIALFSILSFVYTGCQRQGCLDLATRADDSSAAILTRPIGSFM